MTIRSYASPQAFKHALEQRPMPRRTTRLNTSTVTEAGTLVPWLSAAGPLAYTPEDPPSRDYYFQYGWVLPDILSERANARAHYYFGELFKNRAHQLFDFWNAARKREVAQVVVQPGVLQRDAVRAPLAVYAARLRLDGDVYVLMQHGSYQVVSTHDQPLLDSGELVLYRGIQRADVFEWFRTGHQRNDGRAASMWRAYLSTLRQVLSDSRLSFNSIHDRVKRVETNHLRHDTWITDEIATSSGLELASSEFAKRLWHAAHQSFTLVPWVAESKFGPHYVKCKTPIDNVRMTTFFAGEYEVKLVDPDRLEFLECVGCQVRETTPADLAACAHQGPI